MWLSKVTKKMKILVRKIYSNLLKFTQIYSNLLKFTQICPNLLNFTQICSNHKYNSDLFFPLIATMCSKFCDANVETLKEYEIKRVTFIIIRSKEFPKYFTYRARLQYKYVNFSKSVCC